MNHIVHITEAQRVVLELLDRGWDLLAGAGVLEPGFESEDRARFFPWIDPFHRTNTHTVEALLELGFVERHLDTIIITEKGKKKVEENRRRELDGQLVMHKIGT